MHNVIMVYNSVMDATITLSNDEIVELNDAILNKLDSFNKRKK